MRLLVVTAVPVERDAVTRGLRRGAASVTEPGSAPQRTHETAGTPAPERADEPAGTPGDGTTSAPTRIVVGPAGSAELTADVLVVGVGPAAAGAGTAAALASAAHYDLVVSAGIGGGFAPLAPVGALVVADSVIAADLGAQTPDGFTPVTELGFGTVEHRPPPRLAERIAEVTGAVLGTVLSVSTVTGSASRAAALRARHPTAAAEAMEGFGAAEAAARQATPMVEIRAVSNPVGPRDRAAWRVSAALTALTDAFAALATELRAGTGTEVIEWLAGPAGTDTRTPPPERAIGVSVAVEPR